MSFSEKSITNYCYLPLFIFKNNNSMKITYVYNYIILRPVLFNHTMNQEPHKYVISIYTYDVNLTSILILSDNL